MQGANITNLAEDSRAFSTNIGKRSSKLSHGVFQDKFFNLNDHNLNKGTPLSQKNKKRKTYRQSDIRLEDENLRETHQKLFKRNTTKSNQVKPKNIEKKTLFAMMQEDITDPFEDAKETKLVFGQI